MLKLVLLTIGIVAVCVALLAIKILLQKNGRFPNTHIGASKEMAKRGIKCVQSQDRDERKKTLRKF